MRLISFSKYYSLLVLFLVGIAPAHAQEGVAELRGWALAGDVLSEQAGTAWPEIKGIASAPFDDPAKTAKWGLFLAGLVLVDKPVTQFYQQEIETRVNYSMPTLFGSPITGGADGYLVFGVASHYLGGVLASNRKAQETSVMAGKAMAYSYLFAHLVGKTLTGRHRPYSDLSTCSGNPGPYTCDPYDFGNWHAPSLDADQYGTAMPSFHFTMYFSVARVYARSYDNYWLPYTVMAGMLGSNIKGHKHWASDLVAGALLGTFIGNRVVDSYQRRTAPETRAGWELYPYAVSDGLGLYLTREL